MNKKQIYDAIILGAGPSGINCALELHESRVNYLLLDRNQRLGGQLNEIQNTIRNFAARFWESGSALRDDMEVLCHKIGIASNLAQAITSVDLQNKELFSEQHSYQAKTIFLATGTRPRTLTIAGADSVKQNIILNVEENEKRISDKSIIVVGGGDNALMDCLWLADRCPSVLLVNRTDQFKARPDVIADIKKNPIIKILLNTVVESVFAKNGQLESVGLKNTLTGEITEHPAQNLALRIGFAANSELFLGQLKTSINGQVIIDESCQTSIPGIFAGGDLVAPDCWGIARSVGHGLIAARSMFKYLISL